MLLLFKIIQPVKIDGILDEEIGNNPAGIIGLTQRDPDEGKPATQKSVLRIGYDNDAIYIGARMFDSSPDSIIARLQRKDIYSNSDELVVFFGPYNDNRSDAQTWVASGWVGMSNITGNSKRILDVQQNSRHYFQRPDFKSVTLDSNAVSLTGFAGRFVLNRQLDGDFFFNSAIGFISPGYDVNDLGFLRWTNIINGHIGGGYSWTSRQTFTGSSHLT